MSNGLIVGVVLMERSFFTLQTWPNFIYQAKMSSVSHSNLLAFRFNDFKNKRNLLESATKKVKKKFNYLKRSMRSIHFEAEYVCVCVWQRYFLSKIHSISFSKLSRKQTETFFLFLTYKEPKYEIYTFSPMELVVSTYILTRQFVRWAYRWINKRWKVSFFKHWMRSFNVIFVLIIMCNPCLDCLWLHI